MFERHPAFDLPPDENLRIWRYVDPAKLIWTLENSALFFSRADLLGDPHEGAVPDRTIRERTALRGGGETHWAPGFTDDESFGRLMTRSTYVSCWSASDVENAGFWSRYSGGVAIRSTFARLRDSLKCDEPVYVGLVRYIDYRKARTDASDAFSPLMHKRMHFRDERELRAVIKGQWVDEDGEKWRWLTEDPRRGIHAAVDLNRLIEEIRIAPGDPILADAIPPLVDRYGLDVRVGQSSLDDPPRF